MVKANYDDVMIEQQRNMDQYCSKQQLGPGPKQPLKASI